MKTSTIELRRITSKKVSPRKYLQILRKGGGNIRKSEYVPPSLGEGGFGYFVVTLKEPEFEWPGKNLKSCNS
jgi:hypothetical protein